MPRPVEPADLFRLHYIRSASLSPDGKQAAYVVMHSKPDDGKDYAAIWLVTLDSGETRQLTSGTAQDNNPQWSPDGKQIAFVSTRQDKPQIYIIPVSGGEARQLTTLKQGVGGGGAWSPDSKQIAFTAVPIAEPRDPAKAYRANRFVYRFNEMEYLDDVVQDLYIIPAAGGEARQLTHDRYMNNAPQWSPDGSEILYLAGMNPDIRNTFLPVLRVINVANGTTRDLITDWGNATSAAWTPDGKQIAFIGQPKGVAFGSKSDLWVIPSAGGTPQSRSSHFKYGVGGGLEDDMPILFGLPIIPLSSDGRAAYVPAQVGGTVQIYRFTLEGPESGQAIQSGDRACQLMDVKGENLLYIVSTMFNPTDLFTSKVDGIGEKQLTHLNDAITAEWELPTVEHLLFPGSDGVEVEGWALVPKQGKTPLPSILYIHGGPHGGFGHIFHFDILLLNGAGFAVVFVNHRASTGYGDEFSTAIKGDWGNLDYKDLMAGLDFAIAKGIADPNRLGVAGLSGGGNLTCWTIGQTTRFKAAVPENPVTNWVSFYGVSDIGVWFASEELGGHPHEIPEIYAKCAPITYAHRCTTPTLMIVGEHDYRCPPEQAEQFYTTLKANGCTVEMLRLPNQAHGGTRNGSYDARYSHNEALLDWMKRYVLA